jgi:hypothetical protein
MDMGQGTCATKKQQLYGEVGSQLSPQSPYTTARAASQYILDIVRADNGTLASSMLIIVYSAYIHGYGYTKNNCFLWNQLTQGLGRFVSRRVFNSPSRRVGKSTVSHFPRLIALPLAVFSSSTTPRPRPTSGRITSRKVSEGRLAVVTMDVQKREAAFCMWSHMTVSPR